MKASKKSVIPICGGFLGKKEGDPAPTAREDSTKREKRKGICAKEKKSPGIRPPLVGTHKRKKKVETQGGEITPSSSGREVRRTIRIVQRHEKSGGSTLAKKQGPIAERKTFSQYRRRNGHDASHKQERITEGGKPTRLKKKAYGGSSAQRRGSPGKNKLGGSQDTCVRKARSRG